MKKVLRRVTVRLAVVGIGAGAALLVALLVEIVVRIALPHVNPMVAFCSSPGARLDLEFPNQMKATMFDPERDWKLQPSIKEVPWCGTPVTTNSDGVRMDRPLGPKRPGTLRIVCVGDSVTFGYGVPFYWEGKWNADEKAYPAVMETALGSAFPGRRIEVIPLACPGYTSDQGRRWYEQLAQRLDPDIVTVCFGYNDVMTFGVPDRRVRTGAWSQRFIRNTAPYSQTITHLVDRARARTMKADSEAGPPGLEYPRLSTEESVENFWALAQDVRKRGAEFVLIAPVYRDTQENPGEAARMVALRAALKRLAEHGSLALLEVPELTEAGHPDNGKLFIERIHPNREGHELLGQRAAEFLRPLVERRR